MHDLAAVAVDRLRHVPQRSQVRLDRRELAGRHRGERGVLAVRAEQPGVVGPAGAEPAHRLQRRRGRRVGLAGVDDPQLDVLDLAAPTRPASAWTRPRSPRVSGSPGRRHVTGGVDLLPGGDLGLQRARRDRPAPRRSSARAPAGTRRRSADAEPDGARHPGPQLDPVAELAAGAVAVLRVVAARRLRSARSGRTPGRSPPDPGGRGSPGRSPSRRASGWSRRRRPSRGPHCWRPVACPCPRNTRCRPCVERCPAS